MTSNLLADVHDEALALVGRAVDDLRLALAEAESLWKPQIARVHPANRAGALNLVHYWAIRQQDLRDLQPRLAALGLSRLTRHIGFHCPPQENWGRNLIRVRRSGAPSPHRDIAGVSAPTWKVYGARMGVSWPRKPSPRPAGDSTASLTMTHQHLPGMSVIAIGGEVDHTTSAQLAGYIDRVRRPGDHVIFDLTELSFLDSAGLQSCSHASAAAALTAPASIWQPPRGSPPACCRSPESTRACPCTPRSSRPSPPSSPPARAAEPVPRFADELA